MKDGKMFCTREKKDVRLFLLLGPTCLMEEEALAVTWRQCVRLLRLAPREWADLSRGQTLAEVLAEEENEPLLKLRWKHPHTEEVILGWQEIVRTFFLVDPMETEQQCTYHMGNCVWKGMRVLAVAEGVELMVEKQLGDAFARVDVPHAALGEGLAEAARSAVKLLSGALNRGGATSGEDA